MGDTEADGVEGRIGADGNAVAEGLLLEVSGTAAFSGGTADLVRQLRAVESILCVVGSPIPDAVAVEELGYRVRIWHG